MSSPSITKLARAGGSTSRTKFHAKGTRTSEFLLGKVFPGQFSGFDQSLSPISFPEVLLTVKGHRYSHYYCV